MGLEVVQTSGNLERYVGKIKERIGTISHDFYCIGYFLWEVRHFKYYEEAGYSNVNEFAEKELNFKKSSTNNFILLVEKYADYSGGIYPKMWMDKKYLDYGYSQLTEMLSLAPEQREKINSDMTIKEIREVKKELNESDVIISGQVIMDLVEAPKDKVIIPDVIYSSEGTAVNKMMLDIKEELLRNALLDLDLLRKSINKPKVKNVVLPIDKDEQFRYQAIEYLFKRKETLQGIIMTTDKNSKDCIEYKGALHEVLLLVEELDNIKLLSNQ